MASYLAPDPTKKPTPNKNAVLGAMAPYPGTPQAFDPKTGTAGHVPAPIGTPPPAPTQHTLGNPNAPAPKTFELPRTLGNPNAGPPKTMPTPAVIPDPSDPFAAMGGGVKLPGGEWVPKDHPLAATAAPAPAPAPAAPAPAAPAPAGPEVEVNGDPGGLPADPATPANDGGYKAALAKLLADGGKTASMDDPALKAQSDAYAVGQTRAGEMQRAQAAERLASQGLGSSGAADSEYSGITERAGENMAGFNAGLVGDANTQNLQKLTTALSMMGADANSAEGRALQERISNLQAQIQRDQLTQQGSQFDRSLAQSGRQSDTDAELRRLGITTQADLGGQDLRLRDKLGSAGLNAEIMRMLLQNQQFGQGLGADLGKFGAGLNQQAILAMLGGL